MNDSNARQAKEEADRAKEEAQKARQEMAGVKNELEHTRDEIRKGGSAQDPSHASTAELIQGEYDK